MRTAAFVATSALALGLATSGVASAVVAGVGEANATSAVQAGAVGRFRPAAPDYVVLHVPARVTNDPLVLLERQHQLAPNDQSAAADLAALYVQRARSDREPRYFGRAEVMLQPWATRADASAATLRVQADILQNRHDFAGALRLLNRAVALEPRDPGMRLMRASVSMVQGRPTDARPDCAAVLASGQSAAGTVCLAQVLGATGRLTQAEGLVAALLAREPASARQLSAPSPSSMFVSQDSTFSRQSALSAQVRGWALWLLADFADRRGDASAAERSLRAALAAMPENEGVRSALSDALLARGAAHEALVLLSIPAPSVGLLARRARAQESLNDPALSNTRAQIEELLSLATRRGERPHLREEALLALDVARDDRRALQLARANFETQRETIDVRLLVRAARACGDTAALNDVAQWLRTTGFQDIALGDIRS